MLFLISLSLFQEKKKRKLENSERRSRRFFLVFVASDLVIYAHLVEMQGIALCKM